jgi:ribosome-binding factor A
MARIIRKEVDDPNIQFVSITRVNTTSDLKESKIYFSVLGSDAAYTEKILNKMGAFLKVCLGKQIRLRSLPELFFIYDDSLRSGAEVTRRIEEVRSVEKDNKDNRGE